MAVVDRRTEGKTALLKLALENAKQTLIARTSTLGGIREALSPLVAFDWDTFVIRKAGSGPMGKFLQTYETRKYHKRVTFNFVTRYSMAYASCRANSHAAVGSGPPAFGSSEARKH